MPNCIDKIPTSCSTSYPLKKHNLLHKHTSNFTYRISRVYKNQFIEEVLSKVLILTFLSGGDTFDGLPVLISNTAFIIIVVLTTSRRTCVFTVIFTRTHIRISCCVIHPELLIQGEQLTTPLKHCGGWKWKHLSCHNPKLSLWCGHVAPVIAPSAHVPIR